MLVYSLLLFVGVQVLLFIVSMEIKKDFPAYYYKISKRLVDCKPPCIMPIPLINVANIYLQMQIFTE